MNLDAPWIKAWKSQVKSRRKVYKKWMGQLKRENPKALMDRADRAHEEVFKKHDCLECANCCSSIPPQLNRTDINRIAKHLGMKPAAFQDEYITQDEDGDFIMNHTPCRFLNDDYTCMIYEYRPRACREYPHTHGAQFVQHLDLHLVNVRHCPAVFHIFEAMGNFK